MIPSWYINLDRAEARRNAMEAECSRVGIQVTRFKAVDGKTLDPAILAARRAQAGGMTDGEIACYLSHLALWERIAESDAPYGAIFEDDIQFSSVISLFLADWTWIPSDADIIRLETVGTRLMVSHKVLSAHGHDVRQVHASVYGGAGYILSRDGAQRLANAAQHATVPADAALFFLDEQFLPKAITYQVVPGVCVQHLTLVKRGKAEQLVGGIDNLSDLEIERAQRRRTACFGAGHDGLRWNKLLPMPVRRILDRRRARSLNAEYIRVPFQP